MLNRIHGTEFFLDIALGNIDGISQENQWDRATDVDSVTTDIWDRANATDGQTIWTAPTAARVHAVVSSSDEDSGAGGMTAEGNGAKTIIIYGLTAWDTKETSETLTLDGTNSVNTANSYVMINDVEVTTSGSSGPNVGKITLTAATDSTVTAQINASEGKAQMAIFGWSSLETAYAVSFQGALLKAASGGLVDLSVFYNPEPDVNANTFVHKYTAIIESGGNNPFVHHYGTPMKFPGPGILKMNGIGSTTNLDVTAGFDLILVTD